MGGPRHAGVAPVLGGGCQIAAGAVTTDALADTSITGVKFAAGMMDHHVYVTAFSFPVVPRGQARIRTQMSAAHSPEDIDRAVAAFTAVGRELGVIG